MFSLKQRALCQPSGVDRTSVTRGSLHPSAASRTAAASGSSLSCSMAAARLSSPGSEPLLKIWISVSTGCPMVRVPVLSKIISDVSPASPKMVPSRNRMFCAAAFCTAVKAAVLTAGSNSIGQQQTKMDTATCQMGKVAFPVKKKLRQATIDNRIELLTNHIEGISRNCGRGALHQRSR